MAMAMELIGPGLFILHHRAVLSFYR